jgi:hypothetical protein
MPNGSCFGDKVLVVVMLSEGDLKAKRLFRLAAHETEMEIRCMTVGD